MLTVEEYLFFCYQPIAIKSLQLPINIALRNRQKQNLFYNYRTQNSVKFAFALSGCQCNIYLLTIILGNRKMMGSNTVPEISFTVNSDIKNYG